MAADPEQRLKLTRQCPSRPPCPCSPPPSLQCRRPRPPRVPQQPRPLRHGHRRRRDRRHDLHPPQDPQPPLERVFRHVSAPAPAPPVSVPLLTPEQHRPSILHDRDPGLRQQKIPEARSRCVLFTPCAPVLTLSAGFLGVINIPASEAITLAHQNGPLSALYS